MSDTKNVLIGYDGANQHSFSAGPRDLVRLNPGVNTVDAGVWDRVIAAAKKEMAGPNPCKSGGILAMIEVGTVTIIPSSDGGAIDFASMNAGEVISLVEAEFDPDKLEVFLADEKAGKARATVIKAIEKHIAALEVPASGDQE